MKKIIKLAGNWGPIVLLTLGTLWVIQGALAKTSSHGVIIRGDNYDAGTVKAGTIVTHNIHVINLSTQPVDLDAEVGCGCTVVDVPTKPVAPLHDAVLKVKIATDDMAKAAQERTIVLTLHEGQQVWQQKAVVDFHLK